MIPSFLSPPFSALALASPFVTPHLCHTLIPESRPNINQSWKLTMKSLKLGFDSGFFTLLFIFYCHPLNCTVNYGTIVEGLVAKGHGHDNTIQKSILNTVLPLEVYLTVSKRTKLCEYWVYKWDKCRVWGWGWLCSANGDFNMLTLNQYLALNQM